MTADQTSALIRLPMAGVCREYPNAPSLVLNGPDDLKSPKELHPAFYGCFDWHSAVHSHWTMVRLIRLFDLQEESSLLRLLVENLTEENLLIEATYLRVHPSFERMYGWAWALNLVKELHSWKGCPLPLLRECLMPIEGMIVALVTDYLPKLTYPIRGGTHANTAFALTLILDYAREVKDEDLERLVCKRVLAYFEGDTDYPARYEPSGSDFLSPSLCEASLMGRVLEREAFGDWLGRFLPNISFTPAAVSDRSDPQIGHLDGLNLSRGWCMREIASALYDGPARKELLRLADEHEQVSLPHIVSGHYSGEHWLATFATLALIA